MKILVDNKIYDAEDFLIAIYLTEEDFERISDMAIDDNIYAAFPNHMNEKYVETKLDVFREAAETGEAS